MLPHRSWGLLSEGACALRKVPIPAAVWTGTWEPGKRLQRAATLGRTGGGGIIGWVGGRNWPPVVPHHPIGKSFQLAKNQTQLCQKGAQTSSPRVHPRYRSIRGRQRQCTYEEAVRLVLCGTTVATTAAAIVCCAEWQDGGWQSPRTGRVRRRPRTAGGGGRANPRWRLGGRTGRKPKPEKKKGIERVET